VLGLRVLQVGGAARTLAQIMSSRHEPKGKQVVRLHDLPAFTLTAAKPIAFQVDGEYLGECDKLDFASVPGALRVVC